MERRVRLWSYVGRFSLVHVITYTLIALLVLIFQDGLPTANRVALEFFKPFALDPVVTPAQAIRGGILALLLYPFYNTIVRHPRSGLILFGAIWGLTLLGSVEPIPGSIEGLIYTKTTLLEHFIVLAAGAIQVLLFCWLFLRWERWSTDGKAYAGAGGRYHE